MKKVGIALIILITSIECFSQKRANYRLKSVVKNADFNYKKLENFDDISDVKSAFIPVKQGKYAIYTFIATSKGRAFWVPEGRKSLDSLEKLDKDKVDEKRYSILTKEELKQMNKLETSHDILIIKTNLKNEIIDAYQYTLEWAEPQLSYDLFRSTNKNQKLTNGLSIEKLKFYSTQIDRKKEPLEEKGIVRLK